jgi:hypothetical protein
MASLLTAWQSLTEEERNEASPQFGRIKRGAKRSA